MLPVHIPFHRRCSIQSVVPLPNRRTVSTSSVLRRCYCYCCPASSIHLATASSTCLSITCIPHDFTDTQHPWTRPYPGPPSWAWSLLALYRRRPFYFSVPSRRGAKTPPVPLDPRTSCPIYEYLYQLYGYSVPHTLLPTHSVLCFSSVLFPSSQAAERHAPGLAVALPQISPRNWASDTAVIHAHLLTSLLVYSQPNIHTGL
ncbi:hypothetical protein LZ31DRAFT_166457 [Colletotrichum somersetense]|nr:hypothetical protein LZ31DRAFT_166457 [Colletotrichum somersetense]